MQCLFIRKYKTLTSVVVLNLLVAVFPTFNLIAQDIGLLDRSPKIVFAVWDDDDSLLRVIGKNWGNQDTITISNAVTGDVIGSAEPNILGRWRIRIENPATIPCRLKAESGENVAELDVRDAPDNCDASDEEFTLFAFNDIGMHCYDGDFSVFSILPPFNLVHAQLIRKANINSNPRIVDNSDVEIFYSAIADKENSINTTSVGKTNFWDFAFDLFGVELEEDEGLLGAKMPGVLNEPLPFDLFSATNRWFTVEGIPITSTDDNGQTNSFPLMNIQAFNKSSQELLASLDVVVPVSEELHCSDCHATGGVAADDITAEKHDINDWSANVDIETQFRENVIILHDGKHNTSLFDNKPVLCASCHYSPALDLEGNGPQGEQINHPMFSHVMHGRHGKTIDNDLPDENNLPLIPEEGIETCYNCHPGEETKCLRGAMFNAGLICQDCHGGMLAVSGEFALADGRTREPWNDLPKCQSCHTGDAMNNFDGDIRRRLVYETGDQAANPIIPKNKRFAENENELYRNSFGHKGVSCEACHGSPHAIWPVGEPESNDDVAAIQLQGYAGTIIECSVCHNDTLPLTMGGPHGMHNVNDENWNRDHKSFFFADRESCKSCHGTELEGTVLSRAATDRALFAKGGVPISITKGTQISCSLCHLNPL